MAKFIKPTDWEDGVEELEAELDGESTPDEEPGCLDFLLNLAMVLLILSSLSTVV